MKCLRWDIDDLAHELNHPQSEVALWFDGRARAPLAVAAWLEALVKAHKALPPPALGQPKSTTPARPIELVTVQATGSEVRQAGPRNIVLPSPYRRLNTPFCAPCAPGLRLGPIATQLKEASNDELR